MCCAFWSRSGGRSLGPRSRSRGGSECQQRHRRSPTESSDEAGKRNAAGQAAIVEQADKDAIGSPAQRAALQLTPRTVKFLTVGPASTELLHRITSLLERRGDALLSDAFGVSYSRALLLRAISMQPGVSQRELAQALGYTAPAVSSLL